MMCAEGGESPVEEDQETTVEGDKEQPNLEVNSEAGSEEKDSEQHTEQRLLLQDWMNSEIQSPMTENQSCMNQVQLEELHATEVRLGDERAGSKDEQTRGVLNQTSNDINSKMNRDQDNQE